MNWVHFLIFLGATGPSSAHRPSTEAWKHTHVVDGYDSDVIHPYIMMGDSVDVGRYPWYSMLYIDSANGGTVMCGSVLITPTHLVTAAHCVNDAVHVRGKFHLWKESDSNWGYKPSFSAMKDDIFVHPEYNPYTFFADVAIIKLGYAVTQIMPIALNSDQEGWEAIEGMVSVIGHGITEDNALSPQLRIVDIPVVKYEDCVSYSSSSTSTWLPMHVHDDLCAGFTKGCDSEFCADACHGDSGGPIFDPRTEVVFGVVSRGEYPCGKSRRPAMFASMSTYRSFIDEYTQDRVSWTNLYDSSIANQKNESIAPGVVDQKDENRTNAGDDDSSSASKIMNVATTILLVFLLF